MKKITVILLLLFTFSASKAEKVYDFNLVCQQAYKEITQLKLNNGLALIEKAKKQNPENLIPLILESYVDFFVLFFNEDPADYKIRKPKMDARIALFKTGPESSPFYNFCLSVAYLHKSLIAIKFGELWTAAWDTKKAYNYIKDNKKAFPNFSPNDLIYGGLYSVIGTIPAGYRWFTNLLGIKGSVTEGIKMVHGFETGNDAWARLMSNESTFIYCFLMYYIENKKDEAVQYIKDKKPDLVNNHLLAYVATNLNKNNKQTEEAKNIIQNRNKSSDYLVTGIWDYEMGFAKLHHLETQDAIQYLEKFVANFKGKYYLKDVYQKLSWGYYLQGNITAAQNARNAVLKKGSTDSDADKLALKEAKSGVWPNLILLKARLLNDGGYNKEALQLLSSKTSESFSKEEEKLEYSYRLGRVFDDLQDNQEAIRHYLIAIQIGENRSEYYAARAALQTGNIYEKMGNKNQAIIYYKKCIDMDDHDYKNSLDQKAKSGIARCKGE
jgi:tetratricopeptide (TPR) repeat protein